MLVTTPAIVLHTFPYGDTSKIVRLSTQDYGVQSVVAKGATRSKSRFGARLQSLSAGTATFYFKAHRDLHTLSAFELTAQHAELARELPRYASGAALAELVLRFAPSEPHRELFHLLSVSLDRLATSDNADVPAIGLAALWHAVAVLGFAPAVRACIRCGEPLGERARFSLSEGGLMCGRCGRGARGSALGPADRAAIESFVAGSADVPPISPKHLAAHRRLLARFIQRHLAEERPLTALDFWVQSA